MLVGLLRFGSWEATWTAAKIASLSRRVPTERRLTLIHATGRHLAAGNASLRKFWAKRNDMTLAYRHLFVRRCSDFVLRQRRQAAEGTASPTAPASQGGDSKFDASGVSTARVRRSRQQLALFGKLNAICGSGVFAAGGARRRPNVARSMSGVGDRC